MNNCTTLLHDSQVLTTVREFLDIGEIFRFEDGQPLEPKEHLSYELTLEHVSYRYPGARTDTLHDINLTIHPGEKLAVVGLNGAGKTTLIKLIAGLYDPSEGRVLLNGCDIRQYNRRDYYRHFAAVFQNYSVYPLSIAVNVAQSLEPDEEKVNKCIAMAEIYAKFNDIVGDKTGIYISHRLSSCRFCDSILVFDAGAVVQKGTHEQLVADEQGHYYALWSAQAQYYT